MPKKIGFQQQLQKSLILKAQSGDSLALETIYNTYKDACYNLAVRICGSSSLAQDIVQEVFIRVINKIKDFKYDGSFPGWVRKITANEIIDHIRVENKLHLIQGIEPETYPSEDLFGIEWLNASIDIELLISKLSSSSRAVLMLHELNGFTHKEIALMFHKSESFSKVTLSRAYSQLREIVTEPTRNGGVRHASNR